MLTSDYQTERQSSKIDHKMQPIEYEGFASDICNHQHTFLCLNRNAKDSSGLVHRLQYM